MYRKIEQQTKEIALSLWHRGWSVEDIVDILGISQASLYCWQAIFDEMGTVIRPTIRRAERIISQAVMDAVYVILRAHPNIYLDELMLWLAVHHDIVISRTALHETLKRNGLTRKLLQKVAIERDKQLRQEWKALLEHESLNECTYACHYGRSLQGSHAILEDVFIRGERCSMTCVLTVDGCIAVDAVIGLYDSVQFFDFIAEEVLPQMNPFPDICSVLVLDNCRLHHSQLLVELLEAAG
ncbi:hypothetical protein BKA70DRAFT_1026127, partial [Coprinopsis sp. MPI-PUGE-AT-0042]